MNFKLNCTEPNRKQRLWQETRRRRNRNLRWKKNGGGYEPENNVGTKNENEFGNKNGAKNNGADKTMTDTMTETIIETKIITIIKTNKFSKQKTANIKSIQAK